MLADDDICCTDEFDRMSVVTRSVLLEVTEQQTLSIAKARIICQLNARTSLLAATNPCKSQWNKNKIIIKNIEWGMPLQLPLDGSVTDSVIGRPAAVA